MSPTLLLVHGAWHGPWAWDLLLPELDGLDVRTVALPTSGHDPASLGDMYDDARTVREAVAAIDGPTVVVAHSYGGIPVTESLTADDGVQRIVYVTSFQLDVGESLLASVGGTPPPWWEVHEEHIVALTPEDIFYNDVDAEHAKWAMDQLGVQSRRAKEQPLTNAAWRSVPSTYIICEQDHAIPPFAQEAMAGRADEVLRIDAGHSPFLSRPAELASLLRPVITY